MLRRIVTAGSKLAFNILYKARRKSERACEIVFLSRRTDAPSYDYEQLGLEFERRGWRVTMHLKKVTGANMISYVFHVLEEIKLLGRCKLAVIDRYDPVVSLLDFECEVASDAETAAGGGSAGRGGVHHASEPACGAGLDGSQGSRNATMRELRNVEFPLEPVILQMWHAFGAFKKFGYQSIGTPEGHSADFTHSYSIHRNYSWVMCSGAGVREQFAEAFSCPVDRVVALDRPEYDELTALAARRSAKRRAEGERPFCVLMAPTLRINDESAHPFRDLYRARETFEDRLDVQVTWSFHPLEEGMPAPGNVSDALLECDCVVTDYSSIVYEAYLLGVPVVFYVPDIDEYRLSPGLNTDPVCTSPGLCAQTPQELVEMLRALSINPEAYDSGALASFVGGAFDVDDDRSAGSAASRLADFLVASCR